VSTKARDGTCFKGLSVSEESHAISQAVRLGQLRLAGELGIPFTSGVLLGIGERREDIGKRPPDTCHLTIIPLLTCSIQEALS
jgi:hypothetical protein